MCKEFWAAINSSTLLDLKSLSTSNLASRGYPGTLMTRVNADHALFSEQNVTLKQRKEKENQELNRWTI